MSTIFVLSSSMLNHSRQGHARITIFASQGVATTFDYQPGDIAYVPASMGHYVENIGSGTMKFLEVFNTGA